MNNPFFVINFYIEFALCYERNEPLDVPLVRLRARGCALRFVRSELFFYTPFPHEAVTKLFEFCSSLLPLYLKISVIVRSQIIAFFEYRYKITGGIKAGCFGNFRYVHIGLFY